MICFFLAAFSLFAEKTDVLFYIQDAGESFALMPVMKELEKKGVEIRVLAAGLAADLVKKGEIASEKVRSFRIPVDRNWARGAQLPAEEIGWLVDEIEANVVVAGVAFESQGQVLEAYRNRGATTCAYWDNFNAAGDDLYFATAQSVQPRADLLLLPSAELAHHFMGRNVRVVGQPSLEQWEKEARKVDLGIIRGRLGLCPCKKPILFVGGYGDDYNEAFRLFIQCVDEFKRSDYLFYVQPHPKFGGAIEKELLLKYSPKTRTLPIRILQGEVSTVEMIAFAETVVCHQSSVGFQAIALDKPVVYLTPPGQNYNSLPLQKGLAQQIFTSSEFEKAVCSPVWGADFYELLGVPRQSAELTAQTIEELCRTSPN
ncbi:MAG: hypothetical protein JSS32_02425 [Verrucomicrobia bacterium]|nr:hypothetical protein [Verrucomicrobiota bacterium]